MPDHTALPWRIRFHRQICNEGGQVIAVCENPVEANARFIVTACNCHADLLEACEFALSELSDMTTVEFSLDDDKPIRERLEQAIRKAKETP